MTNTVFYERFHFRWLNIKGIDAAFPILVKQFLPSKMEVDDLTFS